MPSLQKLPRDILSKIFVRLFAKQLAQMRCVSKSLNAFLSESSFVKSHLHHSTQNNDETLFVFYDLISSPDLFFDYTCRSPHLDVTNIIKFPFFSKSETSPTSVTVVGSVNGLICFYEKVDERSIVHICNPSLSAVLTLPLWSTPSSSYLFDGQIEVFFRFGYDPKTDDYKVVKLTSILQPPKKYYSEFELVYGAFYIYVVKEWLQVEVYSMKKGSWQLITERPPSHVTRIFNKDEVCVDGHDGHLHWLVYIDEEMKAQTIVAFDLGVETFREITLPESLLDNVYERGIGVLAKKLCVMARVRDGECEVWLMEEYGVAETWVKHHVISQFSGNIAPFGFTSRNEFVFEAYNCRLVLYDPVEAMSKSSKVQARLIGITKIVEYVDSLVWVAPTKHVDGISCSISQLKI